jgi:hypothetical protein
MDTNHYTIVLTRGNEKIKTFHKIKLNINGVLIFSQKELLMRPNKPFYINISNLKLQETENLIEVSSAEYKTKLNITFDDIDLKTRYLVITFTNKKIDGSDNDLTNFDLKQDSELPLIKNKLNGAISQSNSDSDIKESNIKYVSCGVQVPEEKENEKNDLINELIEANRKLTNELIEHFHIMTTKLLESQGELLVGLRESNREIINDMREKYEKQTNEVKEMFMNRNK